MLKHRLITSQEFEEDLSKINVFTSIKKEGCHIISYLNPDLYYDKKEIQFRHKHETAARTKSNGYCNIDIIGFGGDEEQAKSSFIGTIDEIIENLSNLKHNIENGNL